MSMTIILHPHLHHVSRSLLIGSIFLRGHFGINKTLNFLKSK